MQDIYKQEGQGVVFIEADGVSDGASPFGEQQNGTATGSGFLLDKQGTILTNAHVVAGAAGRAGEVRGGRRLDPGRGQGHRHVDSTSP